MLKCHLFQLLVYFRGRKIKLKIVQEKKKFAATCSTCALSALLLQFSAKREKKKVATPA